MKKTFIIALIASICTFGFSQDNRREKIESLKIAFITENLNLSQTQAQKFWPLYNSFQEKQDNLYRQLKAYRKKPDIDQLSETEAKTLIEEFTQLENSLYQLRQAYMSDLLKVMPAKKVLKLKKTEDDFRRKMFEEYKKRHQERKNCP